MSFWRLVEDWQLAWALTDEYLFALTLSRFAQGTVVMTLFLSHKRGKICVASSAYPRVWSFSDRGLPCSSQLFWLSLDEFRRQSYDLACCLKALNRKELLITGTLSYCFVPFWAMIRLRCRLGCERTCCGWGGTLRFVACCASQVGGLYRLSRASLRWSV